MSGTMSISSGPITVRHGHLMGCNGFDCQIPIYTPTLTATDDGWLTRLLAAARAEVIAEIRKAPVALAGPADDGGIRCEETLQRAPDYPPCLRQAVNVTETNYGSAQMACKLHTTVTVRSGGKLIRPLTTADYEAAQETRRQQREDWWRDKVDSVLALLPPTEPK